MDLISIEETSTIIDEEDGMKNEFSNLSLITSVPLVQIEHFLSIEVSSYCVMTWYIFTMNRSYRSIFILDG
jgi:hypothetical protein